MVSPGAQTRVLGKRRPSVVRRLFVLALVVAILAAGGAAFRGAGRWLVRPDSLERAEAIAVLSGSMPYRAEEAANIYRIGYAPEVWVTRPESPVDTLARMGIHYFGEEEYDRQILTRSGVPDAKVRILPGEVTDTEEELIEIASEMRQEGKTSVIIVTSPAHTRRVKALWRRLAGENLRASVCDAPQDPFDANHWWGNTRDTFSVVREILGLTNAWLGLPVRPASH
jgi:uncharacterized SAM-binding protein YcdF (DUF218 family)